LSDINTNLVSRPALARDIQTKVIFSMDDFPVPSGGIITLETSFQYLISANLTTSDRFELPAGSQIAIRGVFGFGAGIEFTGMGTLFSSAGRVNRFHIDQMGMSATMAGATLVNVQGDFSQLSDCLLKRINWITTGGGGFGNIQDFGIFIAENMSVAGIVTQGVDISNCSIVSYAGAGFFGLGFGSADLFAVRGLGTNVVSFTENLAQPLGAEATFFISPDISPIAQVNITRTFNLGNGAYFREKSFGQFQSIANNTVVKADCNSVLDSGGLARFGFAGGPDLSVGDQVTNAGFGFTQYNGVFIISSISINFQTVESLLGVPLAYAGTDETTFGTVTRQYRVFTTDDTTGIVLGEGIQIKNTLQNNGSFSVRNFLAAEFGMDGNFSVPATFTIDEAGDYDTGSIDETDPRMQLFDNGAQKDSKEIALGNVNGNTTASTISDGVYATINTGVFIEGLVTERFTLISANAGIFRYDGANPFEGFITGSLAATKAGSVENYRFAMSLNGGIPLFNAIASTAITSVITSPLNIGNARFVHAGTTPPVGSFVTLSAFDVVRKYNIKGLVIFSDATNFEIDGLLFSATDTGNYIAARANFIPMEVKTTKVVVPLLFSAKFQPGNTIQVMCAGDGTANDPTIVDLTLGVF